MKIRKKGPNLGKRLRCAIEQDLDDTGDDDDVVPETLNTRGRWRRRLLRREEAGS